MFFVCDFIFWDFVTLFKMVKVKINLGPERE